ncbi:MAG: hypothetical protein JWL77_2774 [Chthonomonadaceae bacterium]|nr:hypothetical protein [Chthonomonadaceae bacterium]
MYRKVARHFVPALEMSVRFIGLWVIQNRIFRDLYRQYYYWEGVIPMSNQEINDLASKVEEHYFRIYLAS